MLFMPEAALYSMPVYSQKYSDWNMRGMLCMQEHVCYRVGMLRCQFMI